MCRGVNATRRSDASQGFSERYGRSAVKKAERLGGPLVDRHAGFEIILTDVGKFYTQMSNHGTGSEPVKVFQGDIPVENRHEYIPGTGFDYFCADSRPM
jgi:hypothetical protein